MVPSVFGSEGDRSAGLCQKEHGKYKYIVEVCKSMKNELLQWVQPRVVEGKWLSQLLLASTGQAQ